MQRVVLFGVLFIICAAPATSYQLDLSRYFSDPATELRSRAASIAQTDAFLRAKAPATAAALLDWLRRYDRLLVQLNRHDIYVYLRAESDDRDVADAKTDDALNDLLDRLEFQAASVAMELGTAKIDRFTKQPALAPYRFFLRSALTRGKHEMSASDTHVVTTAVQPMLDAAAVTYRRLRKSSEPVASHQETYAALLITVASGNDGIARLRGFRSAVDASYEEKSLNVTSVARTLRAVSASNAYRRYLAVTAQAPSPGFSPAPTTVADALPLILAAENGMGAEYAGAYDALLDPANRRFEICADPHCDDSGFSVGFAGSESGVFLGGFDGSIDRVRALSHESGHAVHRQFMNEHQPLAVYNTGPHFMFESFAIFNELLFWNHLYESATEPAQRAYYLNAFLKDATFQVFGSAAETDLEQSIYHGLEDGALRGATDFNALSTSVFARYEGTARADAQALYWAKDRLFYTDPLYDVNYLYAGLLALRYFGEYQQDSAWFSQRYVALLKNGFNDTPSALERRFLQIDLDDEPGLVARASTLIDERTSLLASLYARETQSR